MNKDFRMYFATFLLFVLLLSACATNASPSASAETRETLYQVSTINSLMAGNYDGIKTAAQISNKGDFGIGTFDALEGEMVLLDGQFYQVKDSGKVESPNTSIKLPFTAVTFFDADITQDVSQIKDLDALKATLDKMIVEKDKFYAIKVAGSFSQVKVRSVPKQQKPYPVLSEVTKNQPVFDYENVKGTLVGFWCPDYVGGVNVPGYHLHFISDDRSQGGHLLNVNISNASIKLDETRSFEMELSDNAQLESSITDTKSEIEKVEK
jgi:acetolactate decarboxylase